VTLQFRNVEVDQAAPLGSWPYEGLVTLIERGGITDLARLTGTIRNDPWGIVARQVEQYLSYSKPPGIAALLERTLSDARAAAEESERAAVAARVAELIERSGLTLTEFASRIGTSRSRLSTYRSGSVVPSATLLLRMERVTGQGEPE
jgi:hypothetical protein